MRLTLFVLGATNLALYIHNGSGINIFAAVLCFSVGALRK